MDVRATLRREVSVVDAVVTILAGLSVVFLLIPGLARWLGLAFLALVLVRIGLHGRIQRRRWPARTETVQGAALIPWDCETVWNLVKPAEKTPLLDPAVRRGYHVPGTPSGVGEQQVNEMLDGSIRVLEVVEYVHNRRAVVRQVQPPADVSSRSIQAVEPTDGGCVYTWANQIDMQAGQRIPREFEAAWHEHVRQQANRIRQVLTDAGVPQAQPSPPLPPPTVG